MEISARRPPAVVNEITMDRVNPVEGETRMADVAAGAALGAERSSSPAVAMPAAAQPLAPAAQPMPAPASAAASS